jgi:hypothetical protein
LRLNDTFLFFRTRAEKEDFSRLERRRKAIAFLDNPELLMMYAQSTGEVSAPFFRGTLRFARQHSSRVFLPLVSILQNYCAATTKKTHSAAPLTLLMYILAETIPRQAGREAALIPVLPPTSSTTSGSTTQTAHNAGCQWWLTAACVSD